MNRIVDVARGLRSVSPSSFELLLRNPGSLAVFQAEVLRIRRALLGLGLPLASPAEIMEFEGEYRLAFGVEGEQLDHLADLFLVKLVAMLQPARVFEIGTNIGTSTRLIAMYAPPDVEIFTLDLAPDIEVRDEMTDHAYIERARRELGRLWRGTRWEGNITQLLGDSMTFDFSPYHRSIDLIYVDGSHSHAYVESDTRNALAMIRPGGVILWDDYGSMRANYGTTTYLEDLRRAGLPVYALGRPSRAGVPRVTNRAAMRVTAEVLERCEHLLARPGPGPLR